MLFQDNTFILNGDEVTIFRLPVSEILLKKQTNNATTKNST